jgi:hypothetical protein
MRAHAESINLTLAKPLDENDARKILSTVGRCRLKPD